MCGVPARQVMAELFGRVGGVSGGMGGSMHMFDRERRFMGGYAIVGESCPIAVGIAYAIAMRDLPEAVICFFGDGAMNQGAFHEALNMAGLWHLPVLFVCENNHYAIGTEVHRHSAVPESISAPRPTTFQPRKSTAWTCSRSMMRLAARWITSAVVMGHSFWSAKPIAIAAIRWPIPAPIDRQSN